MAEQPELGGTPPTPPATRSSAGRFVKGVSGNPKGRAKGSRNKITLVRLETEEALRDFLAPRAKKILREAVRIALADGHPHQAKMLVTLLDKTLSSLRNEDVGETKDTSVTVNINDLTSVRKRTVTAVDGEFTPVQRIPPPPKNENSQEPIDHVPDQQDA